MTSIFSFNKLRTAMGSAGASADPAPSATPGTPSGKSKSSSGFNGLQGRENPAQSGGMAPRGRSPMMQAFSNAAMHAHGAVHQASQGMQNDVQKLKNGYSAFRAESHAASRPNFSYPQLAGEHRLAQADHRQRAQAAYSQAAGHARAFFGETAHGMSQGARQAASSLASTMERFDPRRLAHQAKRYGNAALHQATQVAMVGVGGALLAGAAVAHGVNAARHKVGQVAHSAAQRVDHAMYRADQAIQSAVNRAEYAVHSGLHRMDNALHRAEHKIQNMGHRIDQAVQSAVYRAEHRVQTALNQAAYPFHAAAQTYQSLAHAASVFKHDMAHFDPYRMSNQYQRYQSSW
ncbi:hypothetical protein AVHY2522_16725 [Acidovorax sp. SUPP2522]|uniref:hypothetical protein n=1 Tax=unclassified Acidovorax TaxID=2684926 RepID=UPI002349060F|nr:MULTISPECIES: hypothetical protein [unclassified Acidovorax]WCM96567.1 hypothetical protein M5C96_19365 [Acidovorax sp. GBBC 1281]GKT17870.1 hypothetical protein AVHY2522_16725 [Acidovorax sp. SUPP2522]